MIDFQILLRGRGKGGKEKEKKKLKLNDRMSAPSLDYYFDQPFYPFTPFPLF